ncbi:nitrilase-related carbon-nitrogen hydrolase [Puia sp. P3]|uniref:nitrilase-related carbon-nitrogen hydrolase n=1 Tax=Puia sp. P3 TaxID=3423952 RepID=UPI003D6788CF
MYGEFMSRYVRNGANVVAIITNDGWWGNTPGYRQHESYARLRAIETRRWVIRSANTGVSCVISPAGEITTSRPLGLDRLHPTVHSSQERYDLLRPVRGLDIQTGPPAYHPVRYLEYCHGH